jgi:hypothetical protein
LQALLYLQKSCHRHCWGFYEYSLCAIAKVADRRNYIMCRFNTDIPVRSILPKPSIYGQKWRLPSELYAKFPRRGWETVTRTAIPAMPVLNSPELFYSKGDFSVFSARLISLIKANVKESQVYEKGCTFFKDLQSAFEKRMHSRWRF